MTIKMRSAPSPRGTNHAGLMIPESWLTRPLATDAAPMYPTGTPEQEVPGMDANGLLAKLEAGDSLSPEELQHVRLKLTGATDRVPDTPSEILFGPLAPKQPKEPEGSVKDEELEPPAGLDEVKDYLRQKGVSDEDLDRVFGGGGRMPDNAFTGKGMGGRVNKPAGAMDSLDEAMRLAQRFRPQRGDGFSPRPEPQKRERPVAMDQALSDNLDDYLGLGRIKTDLCR